MDFATLDKIQQQSHALFTKAQVEQAISRMAEHITAELSQHNPVVLCVMTGGLVVCGQLITQLHFPLEMDYIHATRYQNSTTGHDLTWRAEPKPSLQDRTVLLVDDILDGGITLSATRDFCLKAGAKSVHTAVLLNKPSGRLPEGLQNADFVGLTVGPHYVYGYGLDYQGYLRNADGIYAVTKT